MLWRCSPVNEVRGAPSQAFQKLSNQLTKGIPGYHKSDDYRGNEPAPPFGSIRVFHPRLAKTMCKSVKQDGIGDYQSSGAFYRLSHRAGLSIPKILYSLTRFSVVSIVYATPKARTTLYPAVIVMMWQHPKSLPMSEMAMLRQMSEVRLGAALR